MTKLEMKRRKRMREKKMRIHRMLFINAVICFILMIIALISSIKVGKVETIKAQEAQDVQDVQVQEIELIECEVKEEKNLVYSDETWNINDDYLLAKLAMAEAEGCDIHTKCLVIMTVLNRLENDKFPNTIEEIIYQRRGDVYQFSPIGNGRWNRVEPNEDCWTALEIVMSAENDFSKGALYFESCTNADNWHSRNLDFICKSDVMRFYK